MMTPFSLDYHNREKGNIFTSGDKVSIARTKNNKLLVIGIILP